MLRKLLLIMVIIFNLFPITPLATEQKDLKAGFIRDGDLWILLNEEEQQITNTGTVFSTPKWSTDGQWLLYQVRAASEFKKNDEQAEIWAYNLVSKEKKKIFYDGYSPTWSPQKNVIAFNNNGILNISNFNRFYNIATGVDSYAWLPDGSGFLLSASGVLQPDGWTSAKLYKKNIDDNYDDVILFGGVEPLFTLPKEVGIKSNQIIAVNAGDFEFSPSNNWVSFIVSPTASWSMDSNMLCVISSNGKDFEILDEVIFGVGAPKWAPSSDTIAFIAGGGRIVFDFKNKDLKVREMPVSGSYTPPNFADLDFDWVTNTSIVTSRIKEKEWSNDFSEHPLPALYQINIDTNEQNKLTTPPVGYGDYQPQYLQSIEKLVWFRGKSITDQDRSLWQVNIDGTAAKEWIKNVDAIEFYQAK